MPHIGYISYTLYIYIKDKNEIYFFKKWRVKNKIKFVMGKNSAPLEAYLVRPKH